MFVFFGEVNTTEKQCNIHENVSSGKNLKKQSKFHISTFSLVSSCIYTVLSLIFVVSIVTWHFVTFRVNILLKMTHSNTKTTHQMLPPCVLSTKH